MGWPRAGARAAAAAVLAAALLAAAGAGADPTNYQRYVIGERALGMGGAQTAAVNDPMANLYYGDLHRLRAQRSRNPRDRAEQTHKALERYERAAELDPKLPDTFRQLGFLYYQQKEPEQAKTAFEKYLALKPDAPDARRIKEYIVELDR